MAVVIAGVNKFAHQGRFIKIEAGVRVLVGCSSKGVIFNSVVVRRGRRSRGFGCGVRKVSVRRSEALGLAGLVRAY